MYIQQHSILYVYLVHCIDDRPGSTPLLSKLLQLPKNVHTHFIYINATSPLSINSYFIYIHHAPANLQQLI